MYKILLLTILAASVITVDPVPVAPAPEVSDVTEKSITDAMNQRDVQLKQADVKNTYNAEYDAFMTQMQTLLSNQEKNTKEVTVGEYQIVVQTDCDYKIDLQPPTLGTFERDCFTAESKAEVTAKMIVNSSPSNPPSLESIQNAFTNCELQLSTERSITVRDLCYEEGLTSNFSAILQEYDDEMAKSGLVNKTHNDDGSVTYTSDRHYSDKIDLQSHNAVQTTVQSMIGTDAGAIPN
jgi:hypothetical protein